MLVDLYAVLGIPQDADEATIRSAYKILARRYHPDSGAGSSPAKFREITQAYETLSEPERRREYDMGLSRARAPITVPVEPMTAPRWRTSTFDDLFEELLRTLWHRF